MKTKEHKESNSCEKYYRWRNALYKINFWTILKKLLQKNDFHRFPLFEIFALMLLLKLELIWSYLVRNLIFHKLVHLMTHTIDKHKESIRTHSRCSQFRHLLVTKIITDSCKSWIEYSCCQNIIIMSVWKGKSS